MLYMFLPLSWRRFVLVVGDILLLYVALAFALSLRHFGVVPASFLFQHFRIFSFFLPVWMCVFYMVGLYDFRRMHALLALLGDSFLAICINLLISMALFYNLSPDFTPKTNLILTLFFLQIGGLLWRQIWVRAIPSKFPGQRVAFWGSHPLIPAIRADISEYPFYGFRFTECPELHNVLPQACSDDAIFRGHISSQGLKNQADIIVLDSDEIERRPEVAKSIIARAIREGIPILTLPDFYEEIYRKIPPSHAARTDWLLSNVLSSKNYVYLKLKRLTDMVVSVALVIALFPLVVLLCVAHSLLRLGSPFYTQQRVGYLGKEFTIWKLRTMHPHSDKSGPLFDPGARDCRVTRFGALLRRLRLDELPQLWNVLKGEMSLIGPRPEWIHEVRILEKEVPHYHLRHLVQPGITGWAQVNYCATNNSTDSLEKLQYDLYYVKNISLALDVGIALKTLRRLLQSERHFKPAFPPQKVSDAPSAA